MKYYIKKRQWAEVEGPFEVAQLNERIAAGLVTRRWMVTSDIGEPRERVILTPKSDWMPIADVQGIIGLPTTDVREEMEAESEMAISRETMIALERQIKKQRRMSSGGVLISGGIIVLVAASRYTTFYERIHEQGSAPSWAFVLAWLMVIAGCMIVIRGLASRNGAATTNGGGSRDKNQTPAESVGRLGQTSLLDRIEAMTPKERKAFTLDAAEASILKDEVSNRMTAGPNHRLLYMFQHVVLREAAFENHPELIRELTEKPSIMPLSYFQAKAQLRCEEVHIDRKGDPRSPTELDLFKSVAILSHKHGPYTAYVVSMPEPESRTEAYFVAILHKDGEPKEYMQESTSTRYFTLEKGIFLGSTVLCEWQRDGIHINYGDGPKPEMKEFVNAVFLRVADRQSANKRVLLEGGCAAVMMFASPSSLDYHLVCVEFDDGTVLKDAKVYHMRQLELPPQFVGKRITSLYINSVQP